MGGRCAELGVYRGCSSGSVIASMQRIYIYIVRIYNFIPLKSFCASTAEDNAMKTSMKDTKVVGSSRLTL